MKYQVTATLEELKSIGCGETELNAIGTLKKEFNDGWLSLEFEHKDYCFGKTTLDIPNSLLKKVL